MSRLPASKRNALIDDFHNGIEDPDYEVIPSKTTKGRYTVRKRKQDSEHDVENPPNEGAEPMEPKEEPNIEEPEVDDQSGGMFNPIAYLQEYQLQVNKLLIEQMKALRVSNKYMLKKQTKYKDRQKKIRDIFTEIANKPEAPDPEKGDTQPKQEAHEEEEVHEPIKKGNYFDNTYENTTPVKEVEYENPPPPPERPVYQNEYEEQLDDMAGNRYLPSRRNRIKAFI